MQHRADGLGVSVQIKRGTHPAYHHRQDIAQRITDSQDQLRAGLVKTHVQPARVFFTGYFNAKCPAVAVFTKA